MKLEIKTPTTIKRTIGARPKKKGKSLPKNQRGPQVKHLCYHCGVHGHIRPNCFKLHALKKADSMRGQEISKRRPNGAKLREVVRDISLETLWRCWRTYHCALLASLQGLKVMLVIPRHLRLSPKILVKSGWRRVLMHDQFLCPCINSFDV